MCLEENTAWVAKPPLIRKLVSHLNRTRSYCSRKWRNAKEGQPAAWYSWQSLSPHSSTVLLGHPMCLSGRTQCYGCLHLHFKGWSLQAEPRPWGSSPGQLWGLSPELLLWGPGAGQPKAMRAQSVPGKAPETGPLLSGSGRWDFFLPHGGQNFKPGSIILKP